jgi:hypothetical protein
MIRASVFAAAAAIFFSCHAAGAEPVILAQATPEGLDGGEVTRMLRASGFAPLGRAVREGRRYVVRALDQDGYEVRVAVSARTGRIVAVRPVTRISAPGYVDRGWRGRPWHDPDFAPPPGTITTLPEFDPRFPMHRPPPLYPYERDAAVPFNPPPIVRAPPLDRPPSVRDMPARPPMPSARPRVPDEQTTSRMEPSAPAAQSAPARQRLVPRPRPSEAGGGPARLPADTPAAAPPPDVPDVTPLE